MPQAWTRVEPGVIAAPYPTTDDDVRSLTDAGVTLLINLHEEPHDGQRLARLGVRELHIPVRDLRSPKPEQIDAALAAIGAEIAGGGGVAVHCAYGIGRTGTIVACWLVMAGFSPADAIARVRELRPGSVEMPSQERAVFAFAARLDGDAAVQSRRGNT